jgi:DNA invertase Pin-like site-specific DNA recombinase
VVYARVSTEQQDLTAQRNGLHALGVGDDRIDVDHGLTGTNHDRPGLRLALAACLAGDTLGGDQAGPARRSLPDARDILDELTKCNAKLSLGGSIHDPTDPVGGCCSTCLAMVAEFESDPTRLRTREGMKVANAKGRLRARQLKLKPNQAKHLLELHDSGNYTQAELAGFSAWDNPRCIGLSSGYDPSHHNRCHSRILRGTDKTAATGRLRVKCRAHRLSCHGRAGVVDAQRPGAASS